MPNVRQRLAVAFGIGVAAALVVFVGHLARPSGVSDFDQLWFAARALFAGDDPYALIGPGRAFEWKWPLYFPLTAALIVAPFAALPVVVARIAFVAVSSALLAWAVTRDGWHRIPLFTSSAFFIAVLAGQWSPLLTAALCLPVLGWVFAAKPNLGLVLLATSLSRRVLGIAVVGGVALFAVSLLLQPSWPARWLAIIGSAPQYHSPLLHRGGPLVLLALFRWRRPEARLLLAMATVPHNLVIYEVLPLFLIPRTFLESCLLSLLSTASLGFMAEVLGFLRESAADNYLYGDVLVIVVYLPALIMVLRRPNEGVVPSWLERLAQAVGAVWARVWRRKPAVVDE